MSLFFLTLFLKKTICKLIKRNKCPKNILLSNINKNNLSQNRNKSKSKIETVSKKNYINKKKKLIGIIYKGAQNLAVNMKEIEIEDLKSLSSDHEGNLIWNEIAEIRKGLEKLEKQIKEQGMVFKQLVFFVGIAGFFLGRMKR